jgi:membrane protein YqaA with SNARE-associated domain
MSDVLAYAGLFGVSLLSATIFPLQSEGVLVGMIIADAQPLWALTMVASIGNVLGACINWGLGRYVDRFRRPDSGGDGSSRLERARRWYQRYGRWSLLFSWLPVIGDPLTLVAGVLKEPFPTFLLLVSIGKVARYAALAAAAVQAR